MNEDVKSAAGAPEAVQPPLTEPPPTGKRELVLVPQRHVMKASPLDEKPTPARKRWLRLALVLAVIIGGAGGGLYWWLHLQPQLPPGIAFGNGRIEAQEIDIDTKFPGRIAEIFADAGDMVKAGQVVARMDVRDLSASLKKSQAAVSQAQKAIDEANGLLGVSGVSDDMRVLLGSDNPSANEAVALFVYRIGRELGSMAAALGGIDALVFTAGIGEHAAEVRRRVCEEAAWLGVDMDQSANLAGGARITRIGSRTSAWMIPTDEDLMIARHAWTLLNPEAAPPNSRGNNGS